MLGGDMMDKVIVPVIQRGTSKYRVTLLEKVFDILNSNEPAEFMILFPMILEMPT